MRLLRVVLVLVILGLGGLTGYAYFGDMKADPRETRLPVQLDLQGDVPAAPPAPVEQAPAPAATPAAPGAADTGQNGLD